ncbi:aminoglycoside phosphotransferase family protein [Crossiella sp. CA-258035]|uniref:aminoglycoside phosphotransferase family protein n=1 Tax=Crossiella sp. CA-258035 TaxID=2981138 RepID=UPI0024BCE4F7|nr:aminoglycoside phosphotransferase family protein [Crossiella sp. CA-258035]WHT15627.1 aminoglycoside phosphotransferase family protein [Crossiella sp. CA-258035]
MSEPVWWPQALAWIEDNLGGRVRTGEVTRVREMPWSTVATVPTGTGTLWFKANGPGLRYEAGLLRALGSLAPERVLTPLAVDAELGWALLPDGGTTLRERHETGLAEWARMLGEYAQLQRSLLAHSADFLGLGVPDLSPAALPAQLDRLLDAHELPGVAAARPRVLELCAELADSPVPLGLQHDDLHDANVLVDAGGRYRFFDWGDASVAHPFGTLLVTLRVACKKFELAPEDPEILRLRDAYLEPWSDLGTPAELARTATVAAQLGAIGRALAWERALHGADAAALAEWADAVPGWLGELLTGPDLAARR